MEKIQIDTKEYILYAPDSLNYITENMGNLLKERMEFYKTLFDVKDFRKVVINYFDDLDKFREFIYEIRGERKSLPEYARGTFDKGMINAFIESNITVGSPLYNNKLHLASHELFHIMYKELIWEKENKKRVVWFDEGMAQLFCGQYKKILNKENFKEWFLDVINSTKIKPNLNELKHGSSFKTDDYNGYKLSLLAVKYLFDTLGFEDFKKLMHDVDKIESYGLTVLDDAIEFYKNGY